MSVKITPGLRTALCSEVESFHATNQILCSVIPLQPLLWGNCWISLACSAPETLCHVHLSPVLPVLVVFFILFFYFISFLPQRPLYLPSSSSQLHFFSFLKNSGGVCLRGVWGHLDNSLLQGSLICSRLVNVDGVLFHTSGKGYPPPLVVISTSSTIGKMDFQFLGIQGWDQAEPLATGCVNLETVFRK